jgi:hypothetical protein
LFSKVSKKQFKNELEKIQGFFSFINSIIFKKDKAKAGSKMKL